MLKQGQLLSERLAAMDTWGVGIDKLLDLVWQRLVKVKSWLARGYEVTILSSLGEPQSFQRAPLLIQIKTSDL